MDWMTAVYIVKMCVEQNMRIVEHTDYYFAHWKKNAQPTTPPSH